MKEDQPVSLLAGGNPQIAKGDGRAVVERYLGAMPGWKRTVGEWIDTQITIAVPHTAQAVRWNTPFYGVEPGAWFVAFHCLTKYLKVTFCEGALLDPQPPVASKVGATRSIHITQDADLTDDGFSSQFQQWCRQAAELPNQQF